MRDQLRKKYVRLVIASEVDCNEKWASAGASGAEVAEELNLSVAAVYVAKSRVLARIREEAEGLID